MALLLKRLCETYFRGLSESADPRTNDWFMVHSPIPYIFISTVYMVFVLDVGPKYMEKRHPFELRKIIICYNALQILLNGYIVIKGFRLLFLLDIRCSPVSYSTDEASMEMASLTWLYYMIKILDLLDTVFFVLRKKNGHISFLHVYHHFGVGFIGWFGTKFLAGGHSIFLGYINSIVHVIMYSYYLLTVIDKNITKVVWIKKLVTQIQLVQFLLLFCIYFQLVFRDCEYPFYAIVFYIPQNLIMVILFGDFYYKTYVKKNTIIKQDT